MNGKIVRTDMSKGGLIRADSGQPLLWHFRWSDCWLHPCDIGHDSPVSFERGSIRGEVGDAINVRGKDD